MTEEEEIQLASEIRRAKLNSALGATVMLAGKYVVLWTAWNQILCFYFQIQLLSWWQAAVLLLFWEFFVEAMFVTKKVYVKL